MRIDIITLFPDMLKGPFDMSMIWKAQKKGLAQINIHDLRQFGIGPRRQVDDTPYGGGDGMLLRIEPIAAAVNSAKQEAGSKNSKVIFLTPAGEQYTQATAAKLSHEEHLILVCGHYEGFDERAFGLADMQLSVGDYVLTGGELPAAVIVDSVVRLIPGVLGGTTSAQDESFTEGLLEHPHYTRPEEFKGMKVPDVLLSGNHGEIAKWRQEQSRAKTAKFRPDLLDK